MFHAKAMVFDLDGTLLNSNKQLSKRTITALIAARDNGIKLIFATARPPRVTSFANIELAQLGTMVYYNGAYFSCPVTNIEKHYAIPHRLSKEIIRKCHEEDANLSIEVMDKWYSLKPLNYRAFMHVNHDPIPLPFAQLIQLQATKILLTDFPLNAPLLNHYQDELNILITDNNRLVQIMAKEVAKEHATAYLLEKLKLTFSEVACFGDDYNDFGLFKKCGFPVAMGNAVSALKQIARHQTSTNDQDGVAVVIEQMLCYSRSSNPAT
ncbi:Cof subfamily of IIB subfamily of haloacid dehalogenase superfamily/HAD-superfamily hydrolase, subfamily IIB [Amphibacillus marinus]|uniref:Cof subfamily of IIB subfamily of haloacid dehalogenase superfamily/HAD-superfamily hydrolase, subfamily IIB n=1 Tax=Amphibacillus marinus TaxID=872970 RepID=A0A1H8K7J4_9BACI|nr:HAD family hydrolase [Amphibacillus marinus]SEN89009.1 Cof subfamily of IIB subfamily of haloacid dehalogenase superfamily/HAD-superfamily hydrolase, subfamily IIB [Amphibacillus marinus]